MSITPEQLNELGKELGKIIAEKVSDKLSQAGEYSLAASTSEMVRQSILYRLKK